MQEMKLEELLAEAEAIITQLEDPQLPLEEAFVAYERGMKIIREAGNRIDQVEQKMLMVNEKGELVPFTHTEEV